MKISGSQLYWIVLECSILDYLTMSPALVKGRQDAWIVIAVAGIVTLAITYMMARVSLLFAGKSIITYSFERYGKWIGTCIILPYLLVWFEILVRHLRNWGDYVYALLLPNTPMAVSVLLMVAVVTYMTLKGGVAAIGRFAEVAGPICLFIKLVSLFLMPHLFDWRHLQPVFVDSGWKNIVKGIIPTLAEMSEPTMILLMLTPFMAKPQHTTSRALWAIGTISMWSLLATTVVELVLGPRVAAVQSFPWVTYVRVINILDFIQNIDVLWMFIVMYGLSIAISAQLFAVSYGIAQWWHVKDWRIVTAIVILAAFVCVILTSRIGLLTAVLRQSVLIPWTFPVCTIGIPLLLWIVGSLKKRRTV